MHDSPFKHHQCSSLSVIAILYLFSTVRKCLADSGDGNKIVPIAVGVALAVLVIAVIIAFFISKLVNRRRQTSYETLN